MSFKTLPEHLPLFPLQNVLLLPKGQLPLNIFEDKYIAMVNDVLATPHRMIGIVQPKPRSKDAKSSEESPEESQKHVTYKTGCAGRITSFQELAPDRYVINISGTSRFRITKELQDTTPPRSYRQVQIDWQSYTNDIQGCLDCGLNMDAFFKTLDQYLHKMDMVCDKWDEMKDIDQEKLVAMLSMVCPFSSEEKQALLEAECVKTRAHILVTLMNMALKEKSQNLTTH